MSNPGARGAPGSFDQHLTELYRTGAISLDVAMAAASNPSDFERALNFSEASSDVASGMDPGLSSATFTLEEDKPSSEDSLFEDVDAGLGTDRDDDAQDILELVER